MFHSTPHIINRLLLVVLLICGAASEAHADPMNLRVPLPEQTLNWGVGIGTMASFGAWSLPSFGTSFYARLDLNNVPSTTFHLGTTVATKWRLAGKDRGLRLDLYGMAGFEWQGVPTRGFGAMASLALQGVYQRRNAVFAVELLGPFTFQFEPNLIARLPAAVGLWVMFSAGRMWFGIYGNAGVRFVVGEAPQHHFRIALVWALSLPRWFPAMRRKPQA